MTFLSIDSVMTVGAPFLAAAGWGGIMDFLATGAYVMLLIVLCSIATVFVIVLAALRLQPTRVIPEVVVRQLAAVPEYAAKGDIRPLQDFLAKSNSPLARVGALAVSGNYATREDCAKACVTQAQEEIHRLEQGIPVLEMMVTVAPLLGLMGTTAALVGMFTAFGGDVETGPDTAAVAHEIGVALRCTIAGLFVAVPSVLAHTFFARRLEGFGIRMGSILDQVIHDFFTHFEVQRAVKH